MSRPVSRPRDLLALAGFLALTFAAAAVGARFTPGAWYAALAKPSWNPPDWIFAPVWTALYAMMAVAAWRVWRRVGFAGAPAAWTAFFAQLALNAAWSWIFFGRHAMGTALVEIAVLFLAILATAALFWRVSAVAGALLVPYLAWVGFAAALNAALWRLNG